MTDSKMGPKVSDLSALVTTLPMSTMDSETGKRPDCYEDDNPVTIRSFTLVTLQMSVMNSKTRPKCDNSD